MDIKLTKDEDAAINGLKRIAKKWPESLWLFSASGTLYVMRKKDGGYAHGGGNPSPGGVNPDYIVDKIDIENDGGDW